MIRDAQSTESPGVGPGPGSPNRKGRPIADLEEGKACGLPGRIGCAPPSLPKSPPGSSSSAPLLLVFASHFANIVLRGFRSFLLFLLLLLLVPPWNLLGLTTMAIRRRRWKRNLSQRRNPHLPRSRCPVIAAGADASDASGISITRSWRPTTRCSPPDPKVPNPSTSTSLFQCLISIFNLD